MRLASKQVPSGEPDALDLDAQGAAERLARATTFQTISHQDPGAFDAAPFLGLHDYLEQAFPRVHDVLTREVVNRYSLLYEWQGSDPSLRPAALAAHLDVVPIEPGTEGRWTQPPFGGRIVDGYIWGRGTLDDKGSALGILEAVEALLGEGFQPQRTVYLAFGHDEEIGGRHGAAQIAALLSERGVELDYVIDEGFAVVEGLVPFVSEPVGLVGVAEKGYVSVELVVETEGGHSAMPPKQTAIGILSAAIHKLEQNPFPAKLQGPARMMFDFLAPEMGVGMRAVLANLWLLGGIVKRQLAAAPVTNATLRTTTAPTVIEGGVKENILPTKVRAVVNFRIQPGDTVDYVVERVRRTVDDARVQVRASGDMKSEPSPVSPPDSLQFKALQRTIGQLFSGVVVAPGLVTGATDCRYYARLSENAYRFSPLWVTQEDMERVHGTDERIAVEDYARVVRFYAQLLRNTVG
jgi:carboxypeptidase PM20D1